MTTRAGMALCGDISAPGDIEFRVDFLSDQP
jgi:hypothetical protein